MSTKPPSTSSYHHGDLKAALLSSALVLLDSMGVEKLSLRKVALHAGVSHGAPYRHFEDKEGLLAAVAHEGFVSMYEHMSQARDTFPDDDPRAQLDALGKAYVLFAIAHPTHFRLMFGPHMSHEDRHHEVREAGRRCHGVLLGVVQRGQHLGKLPTGDPMEQALAYWSIVQGLSTLHINGLVKNVHDAHDAQNADVGALIDRVLERVNVS